MPTPTDLRRDVDALARSASRDLAGIWRQVTTVELARQALNDVLPALIRQYGSAASFVAAEWYDGLRDQHVSRGRRFVAIPADLPEQGASALAGWATSRAVSMDTLPSLVDGGMTRRISDWSRETVMGSSFADPQSTGWMRTGVGECAFCRMLISRGAVYSETTVGFASHDSCHCQAAPSFGNPSDVFDVEEFKASARRRSDDTREADNARARDWVRDHL